MRLYIITTLWLTCSYAIAQSPYTMHTDKTISDYTGETVLITESGWYYIGAVKNGKPHGQGVMISSEGAVLYGEWANGVQEGKGAIYNPAPFNSVKAGIVKNGTIYGNGILILKNDMYEGAFNEYELPEGEGFCIQSHKKVTCRYKDGVRQN